MRDAAREKEGTTTVEDVDMKKFKIGSKETAALLYTTPSELASEFWSSLEDITGRKYQGEIPNDATQVVVTIHDKKLYTFAYFDLAKDFEAHESMIDHFFESIKFLGS